MGGIYWHDRTTLDLDCGGGYMTEWICQNSQNSIHSVLERVNFTVS